MVLIDKKTYDKHFSENNLGGLSYIIRMNAILALFIQLYLV